MRSVEEKIDIPEGRKDDFRREIMNYIGALAIDGKKFDYKTNERLQKALELKLFEDQKDTIKLTSLVSNVVDKATQEKIDVVKSRLIRNYGYNETQRDGRAELRGQHLRPRSDEEVSRMDTRRHRDTEKDTSSRSAQSACDIRFSVSLCLRGCSLLRGGRRGTEDRTRSSALPQARARQGEEQPVASTSAAAR